MTDIPIYIYHTGCQEYLKKCVTINSKKNKVYLIGDDSNSCIFSNNPNVIHIHKDMFDNYEIKNFTEHFLKYRYSLNQLSWILRIFYLRQLILMTGIKQFFHVDSDCIVLDNITSIFNNKNIDIAYAIQDESHYSNKYNMVGSVHNGLLNMNFCNKFIELSYDIFVNKSRFNLILDKHTYHEVNKNGSVCDMTLYFLLYSKKMIDVINLNTIFKHNDEDCVFDHQICSSYGFLGENTYIVNNGIKKLIKSSDKYYIETVDNKLIRVLSLHFQGYTKEILEGLEDLDNLF
jgi:hypothetical protein